MSENSRRAEVLTIDGDYLPIDPIELKDGMIFKMYEPTGELIRGTYCNVWLCTKDACYDENGNVEMGVEMLEEEPTLEQLMNIKKKLESGEYKAVETNKISETEEII